SGVDFVTNPPEPMERMTRHEIDSRPLRLAPSVLNSAASLPPYACAYSLVFVIVLVLVLVLVIDRRCFRVRLRERREVVNSLCKLHRARHTMRACYHLAEPDGYNERSVHR